MAADQLKAVSEEVEGLLSVSVLNELEIKIPAGECGGGRLELGDRGIALG